MASQPPSLSTTQSFLVHRSESFPVSCGANESDGMGIAADLVLDDAYLLDQKAEARRLVLTCENKNLAIAPGSEIGNTGARLHLDCAVLLMGFSTNAIEVLVLVELDENDNASEIYLLPLAPIEARTEYRLLEIDRENAAQRLAYAANVSFTRGTRITLGTGQQCTIENLKPGDRVLTHDNGAQPLRYIEKCIQRAIGAFAPIRISAGILDNTNDLLVSPEHRLLIQRRIGNLSTARKDLMIKARHLMNGKSVTERQGGFVEYYQLQFDSQQIIYAEGIPVESMRSDDLPTSALYCKVSDERTSRSENHPELNALSCQQPRESRPDAGNPLHAASQG